MTDGEEQPGGDAAGPRTPRGPAAERVTTALFPDAKRIPVVPLKELREENEEPHWLNVPNALTFLRALLVPVILWLLAQDDVTARWWAFGIFLFAAATDSVDGWVARRWHGVTRWGQLADPIADKLLIIGSLASLAAVRRLPWWAVGVIAVRELAVTVLRLVLIRRRDLVMPASPWGKSKTISQVVAVVAYLWPGLDATLRGWLLGIAIVLTIVSGIDYAFRAGRLAREADRST